MSVLFLQLLVGKFKGLSSMVSSVRSLQDLTLGAHGSQCIVVFPLYYPAFLTCPSWVQLLNKLPAAKSSH